MEDSIENKEGKYCPKCGNLIHKKAIMCPHCNYMINSDTESTHAKTPVKEEDKISPMSIISLVTGILGLILFCVPGMNIPFAIAATVLGSLDLRNIKNFKSSENGKGLDIAGIICGGVGIILFIFFITDTYI